MHPLRGAVFENWVVIEVLKFQRARGEAPDIFFWRDSSQLEVDLLVDSAGRLIPIEIKSAATLSSDQLTTLQWWLTLSGEARGYLVYGGDVAQQRQNVQVIPWRELAASIEIFRNNADKRAD